MTQLSNQAARLLVNEIVSRVQLAKNLLDPTGRDLDRECGYPETIDVAQYQRLFDRSGIAKRVVVCLPEESWVLLPEVYDTEEETETPFEVAWKEINEEMNVYHHLYRADVISGIGRFGVLLLGLDDGLPLIAPVASAKAKLLYLRAFQESVVSIGEWETDPTSDRYGFPKTYNVQFKDEENTTNRTETVHWSRVIHVADERYSSDVFGTPRMQSVYNYLLDIRKVLGGSGEMFWRGGFPGLALEVSPEHLASPDIDPDTTAKAMREEFKAYSDGLQRYLALVGVTAKTLAPTVADPSPHVISNMRAIAVALSIPFRVLFGSEQAELASTQDSRTWAKRVMRRRETYLTPMLLRPFIDRLISFGVLPKPVGDRYLVSWPDLSTPTETEQATLAQTRAAAMATYIQGGVEELVPPRFFLGEVLGFSTEQINAIESELATLEPAPVPEVITEEANADSEA